MLRSFFTKVDPRVVFDGRSTGDILRGLALLKLASIGPFVQNAEKLYKTGEKIFGPKLCEKILEKTFYAQFVAGAGEKALEEASRRLIQCGNVKTMICPGMEDLEGHNINFDSLAKENSDRFQRHLGLGDRLNRTQLGQQTVVQYKLSAAFPVESLDKFSLVVNERGEGWERAVDLLIEAYITGHTKSLAQLEIDDQTRHGFEIGLANTKMILEVAKSFNVPILIDAELRTSHTAMYALTIALSALYNKSTSAGALVYGTYQCYFKETHRNLKQSLDLCDRLGAMCGAKLVRGAYMAQERRLAFVKGESDPIWSTYQETSESYFDAVQLLMRHMADGKYNINMFVATHNKQSIQKATQLMDHLCIHTDNPEIKFAQIYGMCDDISFCLGKSGYTVYKSIPWGPVGEWVPYLARRASENHTAFKTARNEIPFYMAELKRRLLGG